jgi:hypothetical protein
MFVPYVPMEWVSLCVSLAFLVVLIAVATAVWRAENPESRSVAMALVFYGVAVIVYAELYVTSLYPLFVSKSHVAEAQWLSPEEHGSWATWIGGAIILIGIIVGIVQAILERRATSVTTKADSKAAL